VVTIIGVDPHKHVVSAVALDERGGLQGHWHGELSERGVSTLQAWAVERSPTATWSNRKQQQSWSTTGAGPHQRWGEGA
jgi:hypothetical protein